MQHADAAIRRRNLLRDGQSILLGVSGGLDSMVLLGIVHELAKPHRWELKIAHLNHRLRGRSSDADERLVRLTAKRLGIPAVIEQGDTVGLARAQKLSVEMAARQLRHEFLARTAVRLHIRTVALAHHADDQVELLFLRLLRGSGGEGLAGMKWQSPSPASAKVQLIRPLLDLSKADLRAYAADNQIQFREDASNASVDILRNRLRHELLPLLRRDYQPALDRTVLRLMDIVGADAEFVTQAARRWLKAQSPKSTGGREEFGHLSLALQRACLRLQLLKLGVVPNFALIEWLREKPGQVISVSAAARGLRLFCTKQGAVEVLRKRDAGFCLGQLAVELRGIRGELSCGGLRVRWQVRLIQGMELPPRSSGVEYFDADKVGQTIVLRHWRPGDRFQPIGMASAVKLQDWFVNQKVAYAERRRLVVAEAEGGEIFWVEHERISERFKLTKSTIRRLQWTWERL